MACARLCLLIVIAVLAAARARAAELVVPDDFASIQAALDAAVPGDTVSVRDTPGPWSEKIVFPRSGTPGSPITLRAFPGDSPILDGTGVSGANVVFIADDAVPRHLSRTTTRVTTMRRVGTRQCSAEPSK